MPELLSKERRHEYSTETQEEQSALRARSETRSGQLPENVRRHGRRFGLHSRREFHSTENYRDRAADEMGMSCPEDYALASFDDYPWLRYFRPRLTTIELPKYDLGVRSTEILLGRISGKQSKPMIERLSPQLCVRESCGFIRTVEGSRTHIERPDFVNSASDMPRS
jgi:substrate-binding family protein